MLQGKNHVSSRKSLCGFSINLFLKGIMRSSLLEILLTIFFYCLCEYVSYGNDYSIFIFFIFYIWRRIEAENRYTEKKKYLPLTSCLCARNIHYTSSILVKIMHLISSFPHPNTQSPTVTQCNQSIVSMNQTSYSWARIVHYTLSTLVNIMHLSQLFFHML